LGVAARQHVERGAGLDVDEQRAVVLAAPDREVVDWQLQATRDNAVNAT
jgi:hypothetical protein